MGIEAFAVLIIMVVVVVVAAVVIPAIIEVRKTAAAAREFMVTAESELKPVIRELRDTLADLKVVTHEVAERKEDIDSFVEAVGDTGRNLHAINSVIGGVSTVVGRSSLWLTGAKVAGKFIVDRISRKGGTKNG